MDLDPFKEKVRESQEEFFLLLHERQRRCNRSSHFSCTALTHMILQVDVEISSSRLFQLVGLDLERAEDLMIAGAIVLHVRSIAKSLYQYFQAPDLKFMPLTDLKLICYEISFNFKQIFFCPTYINHLEEAAEWKRFKTGFQFQPCQVIRYVSKFNEMWIITYLLKREYQNVYKEMTTESERLRK